jgi:hypothetical protein
MQNYVHRTRKSAVEAAEGELSIAVCHDCGFATNATFDSDRLVYDGNYDNTVSSAVMAAYYREIALQLARRYDIGGGLVVDVGCGNGAFLEAICEVLPRCRALGVDPALKASREMQDGRIALVKDMFHPGLLEESPALVVCRHVLEHIPRPVQFLQAINEGVSKFGTCPCFFEVPDLCWIIENEAFWDFCYEHCNYFTATSLSNALLHGGFEPVATRVEFGSQYLWVEALSGGGQAASGAPSDLAQRMQAYAVRESKLVALTQNFLRARKADGYRIAVWGMATKGVLFSLLVDPDATLFDFCVDANANKQGCYVPLTGHVISAPSVLGGDRLLVVIMNENYKDEIMKACRASGLDAGFVSASGTRL